MRYIIEFIVSKTAWDTVTRTCNVVADTKDNAIKAFQQDHVSYEIVSVIPAGEERANIADDVCKRNSDRQTAYKRAMEEAQTISADEFAAYTDYITRRETFDTQNAENIHIGDILCYSWGYDMTLWTYYQVVDIKGSHTIIIRENETKHFDYSCGQGYIRPVRDHFKDSETFTVKTALIDEWNGIKNVRMKAPGSKHYLELVTDALGIHEYNSID